MSRKKAEVDDFNLFSEVTAVPNSGTVNRDLEEELFSKVWQRDTIDKFEQLNGVPASTARDKDKRKYKVRVFSPSNPTDAKLMGDLMNSKEHGILYYKDNWSATGEYRAFVIYYERENNTDIDTDKKSK